MMVRILTLKLILRVVKLDMLRVEVGSVVLSVVMLSVIMLSVVMLSVVMLSVILLNVLAPLSYLFFVILVVWKTTRDWKLRTKERHYFSVKINQFCLG
jgi:hypothetical protein